MSGRITTGRCERTALYAGVITMCLLAGCSRSAGQPRHSDAVPTPVGEHVVSVGDSLAPLTPPFTIAILPFEDYSNQHELAWLRQGLPDMLTTDLSLLPGLQIVSRYRLGEVLREQWLQHRGSFTETPSVRIGKLTGARYLLSGLFYVAKTEIVIEVHVLDVERGAVVRAIRSTGASQAIPALEWELSQRVGKLFEGASVDTGIPDVQPPVSDAYSEPVPSAEPRARDTQDMERVVGDESVMDSSFVRMDATLGLERLKVVREEAAHLVDRIWRQGVRVRLASPEYQYGETSPGEVQPFHVLVPVNAWIDPDQLATLSPELHPVALASGVSSKAHAVEYQHDDPGARQLFLETLTHARRLFVRALGPSGRVLAVYSHGSWVVNRYLHVLEEGLIVFPHSAEPFVTGTARFSGQKIASLQSVEKFDAVIVPVPDEARIVKVEEIEEDPLPEGAPRARNPSAAALRQWVVHRWDPPITESVPSAGYLPGNRRRLVAHVTSTGGIVTAFQILQVPGEEEFIESVKAILADLQGYCFEPCPPPKKDTVVPVDRYRIQFELKKDIRLVGFNQ